MSGIGAAQHARQIYKNIGRRWNIEAMRLGCGAWARRAGRRGILHPPRRIGFPRYGFSGELTRQSTNVQTISAKTECAYPPSLEFRRHYRIYRLATSRPTYFCASTGISERTNRPSCFTIPHCLPRVAHLQVNTADESASQQAYRFYRSTILPILAPLQVYTAI